MTAMLICLGISLISGIGYTAMLRRVFKDHEDEKATREKARWLREKRKGRINRY